MSMSSKYGSEIISLKTYSRLVSLNTVNSGVSRIFIRGVLTANSK